MENLVRDALRRVHYPEVAKDIVACGILRKVEVAAGVTVHLELPTMVIQPHVREAFEREVKLAAEGVAGGKPVSLVTSVKVAALSPPPDKNRVPGVKNIIAVASGKGGVGKSTVATNLALALSRWGAKVGMLDTDVFGPSIPHMLGTPTQPPGATPEKRIAPAVYYGMKVISTGFFVEKNDAVVWRGPMVHKLLQQFMEDVDWGELDYLVLDLPPGTGDVQLSLAQLVPVTGAVMVTTPQEVAVIDVIKGIAMFKKVEVPVLGVIENMAYFRCPSCGHHEEIFSRGGGRKLAQEAETVFLGEIPIHSSVRAAGDVGMPIVEAEPESEHAKIFMDLAARVAGRLVSGILSGPRRSPSLVAIR
ncbi:MAG: iron-sulfur cluster carrier protein ApbC [Deltaproteobacteria bacterium]|nr:iron-sulfur cluster carrier protein ApbC [Deltaproteobacteria bacterium]